MTSRGRPHSERAASAHLVQIKLRLYPNEDDDLIAFFANIPPRLRAALVKQALRSGMGRSREQGTPEEDKLLDALDAFIC